MAISPSSPKKTIGSSEKPKFTQVRNTNPPYWAIGRQLQLRLQYARLKVEHGWVYPQRQNLNEVENLYFRHHSLSQNPSNADVSSDIGSNVGQSKRFNSFPSPASIRSNGEHNRVSISDIAGYSSALTNKLNLEMLQSNSTPHVNKDNKDYTLHTPTEEISYSFDPKNSILAAAAENNQIGGGQHMGLSSIIGDSPSPTRSGDDWSRTALFLPAKNDQHTASLMGSGSYGFMKPSSPAVRSTTYTTHNPDFLLENGSPINKPLWRDANSSSLTYDSFWSSHSSGKTLANYQSGLAQSPSRIDKAHVRGSLQDSNSSSRLPDKEAEDRIANNTAKIPEG